MMKIFFNSAFGLLLWTGFAMADRPLHRMISNLECAQRGSEWIVKYTPFQSFAREYRTPVMSRLNSQTMDCGFDLAAAYDGKSFQVLDRQSGFFYQTTLVAQNSGFAEVVAGQEVAMLYDGRDLTVFNLRTRSFQSYFLSTFGAGAFLSVGTSLAAFTSDRELVIYDAAMQLFQTFTLFAYFDFKPRVIAGRNGVLAYDGQLFYYYCDSWPLIRIQGAPSRRNFMPYVRLDGASPAMISQNEIHGLNTEVCQLSGR